MTKKKRPNKWEVNLQSQQEDKKATKKQNWIVGTLKFWTGVSDQFADLRRQFLARTMTFVDLAFLRASS